MRPVLLIRSVAAFLFLISSPATAQTFVSDCDRLAANPFDSGRKAAGVTFDKLDATAAVKACGQAVRASPEPRLKYQYGRALQKADQLKEAMTWYRNAADQGYAAAEFNVGLLYATGKGVEKNEAEAAKWYRKAADQGSAVAQYHLGTFYLMGIGVQEDREHAFQWFMKSAEQGLPVAQKLVSESFTQGWGTGRNLDKKKEWLLRSAKAGYYGCPQVIVDRIDRDLLKNTRDLIAKSRRAFCYQEMRDFANALKYRNLLIQETDPTDTLMLMIHKLPLVQILAELGRPGEAEALLIEAKRFDWDKAGAPSKILDVEYYERKLVEAKESQSVEKAEKELSKALEDLEKRAHADGSDTFKEGMSAYGRGDVATALEKFSQLGEKGDPRAQFVLGEMYEKGRGVAQDDTQAASWYRKSAEQGYAKAQNSLGIMYAMGRGVKQDGAEAVRWFSKGANQGYAFAQHSLGRAYALGLAGVQRNPVEATKWYRKAAEQGHALAQYHLAEAYASGQGVRRDDVEAASWYRKAAEQGQDDAPFKLGVMYASGRGVPRDYSEAAKWYRRDAEKGHVAAEYNLGALYNKGQGVSRDYAEAAKWYLKAADWGYPDAQFSLAVLYDNGQGVPRDYAEATKWYRKAAQQGHASAQNDLGARYYNGQGVPRDYVMAQVLFILAAAQDHAFAKKNRDLLARRLSGADLSNARQLAASWKKGTPLPTNTASSSRSPAPQTPDRSRGSLIKAQLVSLQAAIYEIFFYRQSRGDFHHRDAPLRYWEQVRNLDSARVLKCHYSTGKRDTISAGYYYWHQSVPSDFNQALKEKLLRHHPIRRIDAPLTECPGTQPAVNTVLR